nr:snaclec rhodocytin subunit beta-like [Vanessa tameamea]
MRSDSHVLCAMYDIMSEFLRGEYTTAQRWPSGYAPHQAIHGKCYKFHSEPLSWHDAYLACKLEEGRLAIINSPKEASIIVGFLGEHLNSNIPDPNILYIGFSDLMFPYQYRTIEGQTLDDAGYASWSPMKEGNKEIKVKRCGAISRTGFLKITYCDRPAMFLCEKILNGTVNSL